MKAGRSSIRQELVVGGRILKEAGVPEPRREATALWAGVARLDPAAVWAMQDQPAAESDARRFRAALERRAAGEPLAYVLGVAGFRHIDLAVDRHVLIPRPETEGLVDHVLTWGRLRARAGGESWGVAADIGTGSGCIALSLAVEGGFEHIVATDASADALELAKRNLGTLEPRTPVEFRLGPLLNPLADTAVDTIVSNPPYVTAAEFEALDSSVRDYEPREALVSREDGMEHTRALIEGAADLLTPGGLLAIEVDSTRAGQAISLAREAGWRRARIEEDLFGRPRYFLATKES